MKRSSLFQRGLPLLLALALLLLLAACERLTAATMHLRRAEGTVAVSNSEGKDVPALENLGLYNGYGVNTSSVSYAWIDLDEVKLVKLDQNSEISIGKEGKALDIELKSGSLFFNVTEPLANDESMNIRSSTMVVGIRGTCGWVECQDDISRVYLLEGKVECSSGDQTIQVNAGEVGTLTADGRLTVGPFAKSDIPSYVQVELDNDPNGTPGPDVTGAPSASGGPVSVGGSEGNLTWSYSDGALTIGGSGRMPDYDNSTRPWEAYCGQINTVTIGNGVTSIGSYAFAYCSGLERVSIPGSVASIGASAFYDCGSLESVVIPNGVASIGDSAFWLCSSLTSVSIPGSVNSIGSSAFSHCGSLESVTIPNGVAGIGASTFSSCGSLTSVSIPVSVTSIGEMAFHNCGKLRDVQYGGSESQWGQIGIGYSNSSLLSAARRYNS